MDSITGEKRVEMIPPDESSQDSRKRLVFLYAAIAALLMVAMFFVGQRVGASGPQQQVKQLQSQVDNLTGDNKKLQRQLSDAEHAKDQFYSEITKLRRQLKGRSAARTSHRLVR